MPNFSNCSSLTVGGPGEGVDVDALDVGRPRSVGVRGRDLELRASTSSTAALDREVRGRRGNLTSGGSGAPRLPQAVIATERTTRNAETPRSRAQATSASSAASAGLDVSFVDQRMYGTGLRSSRCRRASSSRSAASIVTSLLDEVGPLERDLVEQLLHHGVQPARADVLGPLVDDRREVGDAVGSHRR